MFVFSSPKLRGESPLDSTKLESIERKVANHLVHQLDGPEGL